MKQILYDKPIIRHEYIVHGIYILWQEHDYVAQSFSFKELVKKARKLYKKEKCPLYITGAKGGTIWQL